MNHWGRDLLIALYIHGYLLSVVQLEMGRERSNYIPGDLGVQFTVGGDPVEY